VIGSLRLCKNSNMKGDVTTDRSGDCHGFCIRWRNAQAAPTSLFAGDTRVLWRVPLPLKSLRDLSVGNLAGDVIWFSPGEKHWHGATPTTAMTHIAIQEALNGKPVDWMEKVSDEQYQK